MNSTKMAIRTAGFLYLLVVIFGSFSMMYVTPRIIVWGNATATVNNIINFKTLYRIGFVSNLFSAVCFLILPLILYKLLKSVNKNYAILMVILVMISVTVICFNMVNQFAPLILLGDADYLKVFETDQLYALVMLFTDLHSTGVRIAQIFWALWLFPLGYLVFKSGFIPKILGILLMIGCIGYLIESFMHFLSPNYLPITQLGILIAGIAEISFCFWLIIKGMKNQPIK